MSARKRGDRSSGKVTWLMIGIVLSLGLALMATEPGITGLASDHASDYKVVGSSETNGVSYRFVRELGPIGLEPVDISMSSKFEYGFVLDGRKHLLRFHEIADNRLYFDLSGTTWDIGERKRRRLDLDNDSHIDFMVTVTDIISNKAEVTLQALEENIPEEAAVEKEDMIILEETGKPEPTCFDNVLNQGEEGVDCGGPCAACEAAQLSKEIRLEWGALLLLFLAVVILVSGYAGIKHHKKHRIPLPKELKTDEESLDHLFKLAYSKMSYHHLEELQTIYDHIYSIYIRLPPEKEFVYRKRVVNLYHKMVEILHEEIEML